MRGVKEGIDDLGLGLHIMQHIYKGTFREISERFQNLCRNVLWKRFVEIIWVSEYRVVLGIGQTLVFYVTPFHKTKHVLTDQ